MESFMFRALKDVGTERTRQDKKWGGGPGDCSNPHTPDEHRLTILAEEFGEVARAMLEGTDNLRTELVQVAAVAVAWIEGLDRGA